MKKFPTEFLSTTEIGGVGEMIYKAVRFPAYAIEYDEEGYEVIVPLHSVSIPPKSGPDYRLTGQDLLASICNLYIKINNPDSSVSISEAIREWCVDNIYPYDNDALCELLECVPNAHTELWEIIQSNATFRVKDFITDLCALGTTFEFNEVLNKYSANPEKARDLYYEGRLCDSLPFFEKYSVYENDSNYIKHIDEDYNKLQQQVIDLFPDFRMRLKINPRNQKIEYGADVHSVFDICWYTFARMLAQESAPIDRGDEYCEGSILSCMACGEFFVRHSSRQRYCQKWDCQAARNRKNRNASYARHKNDKKQNK